MENDYQRGMLTPIIVLALFVFVMSLLLGSDLPAIVGLVNTVIVLSAVSYYGIHKYQHLDKIAELRSMEIKKLE